MRAAGSRGGGGRKREGGEAGGDRRGWGSWGRRCQQFLCIGASSPRSPAEAPCSAPRGRRCQRCRPRPHAEAGLSFVDSPCSYREKWLCASSDLAQGEGWRACVFVCARPGGWRSRAALLRALPQIGEHRARLQERGRASGPARPALCCAVAAVAPPRSAVAAALGKLCAVPLCAGSRGLCALRCCSPRSTAAGCVRRQYLFTGLGY